MLIEFSAENYLSIRDRVTLSMASGYDLSELPDNLSPVQLPGLDKIDHLLKSTVIYGANASGKTNIILAAEFYRRFVLESATEIKPDDETGTVPFKLDEEWATQPSSFEASFVVDEVRFQYGFSVDKTRVHAEWLYSFPEGKRRKLFERDYVSSEDGYSYSGGAHYSIKRDLVEKTRDNSLYLSMAVQFNDETLMPVYSWFKNKFQVLNAPDLVDLSGCGMTLHMFEEHPEFKKYATEFLAFADTGIEGIRLGSKKLDTTALAGQIPDALLEYMSSQIGDRDIPDIHFSHRTESTESTVELPYGMESAGTQRLFALLGYLYATLKSGICVLVDELDDSLHPLLAREFVKRIHDPVQNSHGAQLVFTTHDTTFLDWNELRRDQFWMVEKSLGGATTLHPLSDFKLRKDEARLKGYLAGRYGGIPQLATHAE